MARRPALRPNDIRQALEVLTERGLHPCSMDVMPDGTVRWHFTNPAATKEDDLDRELERWRQEHGHGQA